MVGRRETRKTVIGKTIGHSKGTIKIKESIGTNGTVSEFIAECDVCSEDKELWPYGDLIYNIINIKRKEVLCGCSRSTFKTLKQLEVIIKRMLRGGDLVFNGWDGGKYKGYDSKMILVCPLGEEWKTTIGNLRKQSTPILSKGHKKNLKVQENIKDLESLSILPKHYQYLYDINQKSYQVSCKVCDECPIFKPLGCKLYPSRLDSLKDGKLPCRCSPTYSYSQQEWELRLTSEFNKRKIDIPNFPDKLNSRTILDWICINGHECNTRVGAVVQGVGCPECSESGGSTYGYYRLRVDEQDCLYLIKFESPCREEVFYKVGRSFNLKSRMSHMKKYYNLELVSTFKGKHQKVYDLEQRLHNLVRDKTHFVQEYFNGCVDECFTPEILNHLELISIFNLKDHTND